MTNIAKTKIRLDKDYTLEELENTIKKGAKFIVYQYCVSLIFAVSLRRFSPAILVIRNETDSTSDLKRKYNRISLIFGWWCFPWGPIRTVQSLKVNKKGGVDVTEDIMLNINESSIKDGEVLLQYTNQFFTTPAKSDLTAFKKSILRDFEADYYVKELVVGLFINTEINEAPFFTIGLRLDKNDNYKHYIDNLKKSLYKKFFKTTYFEFIDLSEHNDLIEKLRAQGEYLIKRERL